MQISKEDIQRAAVAERIYEKMKKRAAQWAKDNKDKIKARSERYYEKLKADRERYDKMLENKRTLYKKKQDEKKAKEKEDKENEEKMEIVNNETFNL